MKQTHYLRHLVAGVLVVAGPGLSVANAQPSSQTTAQTHSTLTNSAPTAQRADSFSKSSGVLIAGGYNVGRATSQHIPGCDGPVSFCNMYFGH
jgi:hypothetical protein